MNTVVTINGNQYYANKRRVKGRTGVYHAVFRPVGTKGSELILSNAIIVRTGFVGSNGIGPFGSPSRKTKLYDVQGWGTVEYMDKRAWQHLADEMTASPLGAFA